MILHQFINHIYPRRLFVIKGKVTKEQLNDKFFEVGNDEHLLPNISEDCDACVYNKLLEYKQDGKYGYLIILKKRVSLQVIAHESVHAAMEMFKDIGAYADVENQEPFAYLVGWISDCLDQVNRNRFKE